mmetsp:Transcript_89788/g.290575  ORF Transcript_89788/g.290575 Transcript_89788/m.290575 type:complete len:247 (-) Transcript_89788:441-1181(-)
MTQPSRCSQGVLSSSCNLPTAHGSDSLQMCARARLHCKNPVKAMRELRSQLLTRRRRFRSLAAPGSSGRQSRRGQIARQGRLQAHRCQPRTWWTRSSLKKNLETRSTNTWPEGEFLYAAAFEDAQATKQHEGFGESPATLNTVPQQLHPAERVQHRDHHHGQPRGAGLEHGRHQAAVQEQEGAARDCAGVPRAERLAGAQQVHHHRQGHVLRAASCRRCLGKTPALASAVSWCRPRFPRETVVSGV